jgi:hypothetical protein
VIYGASSAVDLMKRSDFVPSRPLVEGGLGIGLPRDESSRSNTARPKPRSVHILAVQRSSDRHPQADADQGLILHENARRRREVNSPTAILIEHTRPRQGPRPYTGGGPHVLAVDPTVHLPKCPARPASRRTEPICFPQEPLVQGPETKRL